MSKITTAEAQVSLKKLQSEISELTPSSIITLFEIDLTNTLESKGLLGIDFAEKRDYPKGFYYNDNQAVFRFHNNIKLINTSILYNSDKIPGNPPKDTWLYEYIPMPINAEGFDVSSKGTQATPTLSLSSSEEGIEAIGLFKDMLRQIGDLSGAKVTRIKTYLKYLPPQNFPPDYINNNYDPYVEHPRDVFYIDRKSREDKLSIEFELASMLDLEGIELPLRQIISNRCVWLYRGEGCNYSGTPIADAKDELLTDILNYPIIPRGEWSSLNFYNTGDSVFINKRIGGIIHKMFFVCKKNATTSYPTLNEDWIPEQCSKSIYGCKLRYPDGVLPFGGFPASSKLNS